MSLLFWILVFIGAFLCSYYCILIASYCYAWQKMKEPERSVAVDVFVSVIVAARNEEVTIAKCLDAILSQNYLVENFEILVVNDHSTDATASIIKSYSDKHKRIRFLQLPESIIGKKQAIQMAIEIAKGELIITTDADCVMEKKWLISIATFYKKTQAKMIVAPVCFFKENTFFEKMQSLEFMALMTCGGASLHFNKSIMCNGANLAYSKEAFLEVGGFNGIDNKASGDDVLLMYKISEKHPNAVKFLKTEDAIVCTLAQKTLKGFVQQRKRWASKGFGALNAETKRVSLVVYLFCFYLVFMPFLGGVCLSNTPFYLPFMKICLILFGIKCFIDFLLLFLSASFFKKKRYLLLFIPEQIIYIWYVVVFGMLGSLGKYEWKGRNTN
ncbi:glycosyltransferase [soil metagenome]